MAVLGVICAVCWLSQRMHSEVSMARWGKRATWKGKHISAERSWRYYRMHRAEEGVQSSQKDSPLARYLRRDSAVISRSLQRAQQTTHKTQFTLNTLDHCEHISPSKNPPAHLPLLLPEPRPWAGQMLGEGRSTDEEEVPPQTFHLEQARVAGGRKCGL